MIIIIKLWRLNLPADTSGWHRVRIDCVGRLVVESIDLKVENHFTHSSVYKRSKTLLVTVCSCGLRVELMLSVWPLVNFNFKMISLYIEEIFFSVMVVNAFIHSRETHPCVFLIVNDRTNQSPVVFFSDLFTLKKLQIR